MTPAKMEQVGDGAAVERLKPDVRQRLEKAVLEVFSRDDFHQANIEDVAKKSGVSYRTIYKHFKSKEGLVFAFFGYWMDKSRDQTAEELQGLGDTKEKIRSFMRATLCFNEQNPEIAKIMFLSLPYRTFRGEESSSRKRMQDALLNVIREGQKNGVLNTRVPAEIMYDAVFGLLIRSFRFWAMNGQKYSLASQADDLFEFIWTAMANPEHIGGGSSRRTAGRPLVSEPEKQE